MNRFLRRAIKQRFAVLNQTRFVDQRSHFVTKATIQNATGKVPNKHRSNAQELAAKFPTVVVDASKAVCDGGGGVLGHPVEYMNLDTMIPYSEVTCQYCGTRFVKKKK